MAVGAGFPAGAVQNGSPEGGGVDGAGDGGGGRGDVGAQSVTGASWSKLAGGCWESESSRWTPGWRLEGAAMRWPSSVGERRAGWAIAETGAAGWTIAAILDRMRNQPRNWPGLVPVAAAAGGYPLATPEAVSVGGKEVRNNCQLAPVGVRRERSGEEREEKKRESCTEVCVLRGFSEDPEFCMIVIGGRMNRHRLAMDSVAIS